MVILLALIAGEFVSMKYGSTNATDIEALKKVDRSGERLGPLADYRNVVESGTFAPKAAFERLGIATRAAKKAPVGGATLDTITLLGIISGPVGSSYAIIEDKKTRRQEVFKEGELVFNVGTIESIQSEKVFINSRGNVYALEIPVDGKTLSEGYGEMESASKVQNRRLPRIRPGIKSPARTTKPSMAPPPPKSQTLLSKRVGEREWIVDQRALRAELDDMGKVLTDARLLPYSEGDKVIGFRMSEVKPNGVYDMIGLRDGDVLLSINDYPLDSPEKGVQLLNVLKGESSVVIDLLRNKRKLQLSYKIR